MAGADALDTLRCPLPRTAFSPMERHQEDSHRATGPFRH